MFWLHIALKKGKICCSTLLWTLPVSSCLHQRRAWMNTANTCQTNLHATLKVCPRQNLMTQIILLKSFSHSVIQQYWVCFFWHIAKFQQHTTPRHWWSYSLRFITFLATRSHSATSKCWFTYYVLNSLNPQAITGHCRNHVSETDTHKPGIGHRFFGLLSAKGTGRSAQELSMSPSKTSNWSNSTYK